MFVGGAPPCLRDGQSREIHYGVDETGNYGAYTTEFAFRIQNLTLGVWSGFGTGNDYQEWDFTVAQYQPGIVEEDHAFSSVSKPPGKSTALFQSLAASTTAWP
jgi:hypothetical protein